MYLCHKVQQKYNLFSIRARSNFKSSFHFSYMSQMIGIEIICSSNDRYVLPMFFFSFQLKNKKESSII